MSRTAGSASADNFRLLEVPLPELKAGEVRVRNHFLLLDPYSCGPMDERKSYALAQKLGEVIQGGTAGVVVESRNPAWQPGDKVLAMFGWQEYGASDGSGVRKVDDRKVPLPVWLGAVGMPGVTAWYGLNRIWPQQAGQTVAVNAAITCFPLGSGGLSAGH